MDELGSQIELLKAALRNIAKPEGADATALAAAASFLQATNDLENARALEIRLRLAMHFAPASALDYDPTNPTPRRAMILKYMEELGFPTLESARLADDITNILDSWDVGRRDVRTGLARLLRSQGYRCSCCRLDFATGSKGLSMLDDYKPYYLDSEDYTRPEVDHIEAVSHLGTNDPSNLQVLCRLCNQGKGVGLGLRVQSEMQHSGLAVGRVPIQHRAAMLYYVLSRDSSTCQLCHSVSGELTIRPRMLKGGFIRSNLLTMCYACLGHGRLLPPSIPDLGAQ